jgi:hypothetical protein
LADLISLGHAQQGSPPPRDAAGKTIEDAPVIALWNDGVSMAQVKPFLIFAAWNDGTVIWRGALDKPMGGAESLFDWARSELKTGSVASSEIGKVQAAIAQAGFFHPPLANGLLFPDGPSQSLCVRFGHAKRLLSHYGSSDKWLLQSIAELEPSSVPSRKDAEAFVVMWDKIMKLISTRLIPTKSAAFRRALKLTRPEPFDATDEAGNPNIAYRGIPEHKEEVVYRGTPQSLTTMSSVQVVSREKYLAMKASGTLCAEERHGEWLYFAVSEITQVPNDTSFMEVTSRYKVRIQ